MLYEIQAEVYRGLRRSAGLTQNQLVETSGYSRSTIQRIEKGLRPLSREEEHVIRQATNASRRFFGELVCKAVSRLLGVQVSIDAEDGDGAYQAGSLEAEANELMIAGRDAMPEHRWLWWKERQGRVKALGVVFEQESIAFVRDLREELQAPESRKEEPDEASPARDRG